MAFLYILFSEKDSRWYIGQTSRSIQVRFSEHQSGYVKATAPRRPLHLAYVESYFTAPAAKKREWYLKHPKGYVEKRKLLELLSTKRSEWPITKEVCACKYD